MEIYETRVVAFIDILGFSEVIKDEMKAKQIFDALKEVKDHVDTHFTSDNYARFKGVFDTQITAFSDSVVISGSASQAIIVYLDTLRFAGLLIKNGFLCRGALSVGKLHHSNGLLFGQAFIDAYKSETKRAIYPRIIVDKEVESLIAESEINQGEFSHLLKDDFDGECYIDLSMLNHFLGESERVQILLKRIINSSINENEDKSIVQKHNWLINAYNLH